MPSPLLNVSDLLTPIPITTITEEVPFSEMAMATVARALHGLNTGDSLPAKKEFVSRFLLDMQPWLPTAKEGRIAKRISAYMYKQHRLSVEPKMIETIGTYLGQNSPSGPWMFDITNKFNWKAGDYGDHDACFMGNRRYVLDAMMEDGCAAIRFYEQLERPLGAGRAWIAPSEHGPVIFNSYGPALDLVKGRVAQLLPGVDTRLVKLSNQGSPYGSLYVNQAIAILVGGEEGIRDVNIDIHTGSNRPVRCANCSQRFTTHQLTLVQDDDNETVRVCRLCLDNGWKQDFYDSLYHPKHLMTAVECVVQGRLSSDGYEYEGMLQHVWVHPNSHDERNNCEHCGRLCNGMLFISVGGERQRWCYLCAHDAPLECRYCSFYLPEGESECQCGRTTMMRRGERWA